MKKSLPLYCMILWFGLNPSGRAAEYQVDTMQTRQVRFISDAPLEDFEGLTDRVDGYVVFLPDELVTGGEFSDSEFYFEVDLNSLDTGIGLRNRHMRENYLETARFPFAVLSGELGKVVLVRDSTFTVSLDGELTIHGETRPLSTTVVIRAAGQGYYVQGGFAVALPEHKIEVPGLMFLKINEVVQLEVSFYLRRLIAEPEGNQ